jgi:hypothetical protein
MGGAAVSSELVDEARHDSSAFGVGMHLIFV